MPRRTVLLLAALGVVLLGAGCPSAQRPAPVVNSGDPTQPALASDDPFVDHLDRAIEDLRRME